MKTFVRRLSDGGQFVFVAANVDYLPPALPVYRDTLPPDWLPKNSQSLMWSLNAHPFMPYLPLGVQFNCRLLSCLSYTRRTVPVEWRDSGWVLAAHVHNSWVKLQKLLLSFGEYLWGLSGLPLPVDFSLGRLPSSFNLDFKVGDKAHAQKRAMWCRDAFLPLIGFVSWAISLHRPPVSSYEPPQWATKLSRHFRLHAEFAQQLADSMLGDFTVQRVGVIIDAEKCEWLYLVPYLLFARVPVWVYWGELGKAFEVKHHAIKDFLPTDRDIHDALHPPVVDTVMEEESGGASHDSSVLPPVQKYSRQIPGETWREYFRRMDESRARRLANESLEQQALREQRETLQPEPGKSSKAPRLFYWEYVEGFRIRRAIGRQDAFDFFHDYVPSRRRYDSVHHEWDICSEFDPDCNDLTQDDLVFDAIYGADDDDDVIPVRRTAPTQESATVGNTRQWDEDFPVPYPDSWTSFEIRVVPTFTDILRLRYGIDDSASGSDGLKDPTDNEWSMVMRQFDHQDGAVPKSLRRVAKLWVDSLLACGTKFTQMPGRYWDLSEECASYLGRVAHCLVIKSIKIDKAVWYWLRPEWVDAHENAWRVVVPSAASALHCLRSECGSSSGSIVSYLVEHGIPFQTMAPLYSGAPRAIPIPLDHLSAAVFGLGFRAPGYVPDRTDYIAYGEARDEIFNGRKGRAALMMGGIIWRLAIESLGVSPALAGPTDHALVQGERYQGDGHDEYYDNTLSEDKHRNQMVFPNKSEMGRRIWGTIGVQIGSIQKAARGCV